MERRRSWSPQMFALEVMIFRCLSYEFYLFTFENTFLYFCSYVSTIYMWVYKVSCKKICLRCKVWFKKLSQPECKLLEISFNEFGSPLRITIGHQDTILASTHSDPLYQREAINGFLKELQIYLFFCPRYYKKGLGLVSAHNILKLFSYLFQFSAVFLN